MITADIDIERLVEDYPFSVKYLAEQGIRCIACGEPIWGTLAEAAAEKGFTSEDTQKFVAELNSMAQQQ